MVNSLLKVDFSHPTGHYTWENFLGPLEKILGAPLLYPILPGLALPYTALFAPVRFCRPSQVFPSPVRQ